MSRGLFLILPGHGHVNPTIGLVNELVNKGDEIVYITAEEFRDKLEKVGAKFLGYELEDGSLKFNPNEINKSMQDLNNSATLMEKFMETSKKTLELIFTLTGEFDYLVIDHFLLLDTNLFASKFNIKKIISSVTTFALNEKLMDDMFNLMMSTLTKNGATIPQDIKENMTGIREDFLNKKCDLKIVFTSKYYQPYGNEFDDSFKFVGPSIFDRKELIDFKIEKTNNKKLILASLGTVANENQVFYKNCFEALGGRNDIDVIMSIGKRININDLGKIPKNFKVYNYVPQLEVLKHVDLFITHGGMNSSSEGLYNDVPLIVVPQFGDQPIVANRVANLKAGLALIGDENLTPSAISKAVDKILSCNLYKENAQKIGKSLRELNGYEEAANLIKKILL